MTDYTERFRTLSMSQMQQVLAFLCAHVEDTTPEHTVFCETMNTLLGQPRPFNVDPADEALVDAAMAKRETGLNVEPMARESRVIRSGDLVVGKRYRIVEISQFDHNPSHAVGDIVMCDNDRGIDPKQRMRGSSSELDWLCGVPAGSYGGTYVTAVELVEDELTPHSATPERCPTCGSRGKGGPRLCADQWHVTPVGPIESVQLAVNTKQDSTTIIRAAEGVTLEPGEYYAQGGRIVSQDPCAAIQLTDGSWVFEFSNEHGFFAQVTAVRRVDPKPASEPETWADEDCDACEGSGRIQTSGGPDDIYRGWRWCDCAVQARDEAKAKASEPVAPAAGGRLAGCTCTWVYPERPCAVHGSPPQQPAERVEPVAELASVLQSAGARVTIDADLAKAFSALNAAGSFISAASDGGDYPNSILSGLDSVRAALTVSGNMRRERDAALATISKLTAELEAARLESDKLIATLRQQYDGCCDANDGLVEELSTTRARLAETPRELESARAGLDPKACGELIATVTQGVGTANQLRASAAFAALGKLAAMLGVEVAGG